jgi:hypothetical protein
MATTKKAKPAAAKRKPAAAKKPLAKKAATKSVRKTSVKTVENPTTTLLVYVFTALCLLFLILATVKYA